MATADAAPVSASIPAVADADGLQLPHDILLPEPVGLWPPAPGWWLLMLFVVLAGFWLWRYWRRERRRRAPLRLALKELAQIGRRPDLDDRGYVSACNQLLRRVAIARHGRAEVAGLVGERWLRFLDNSVPNQDGTGTTPFVFSQGPGLALSQGYQLDCQCERAALQQLVGAWLRAQYPKPRLRSLFRRRSHV